MPSSADRSSDGGAEVGAGGSRARSRAALVVAGLAAGAAFLWFALRGVDLAAVADALRGAHWLWPGPALVALTLLFGLVKAWRWRVLLEGTVDASTAQLAPAVYTGLMLNALIPHSGEFARALSVGRRWRVPASTVLASIGVERSLDFLAVLALAAAAGLYAPVPPALEAALRLLAWIALALGAALAVALVRPAFVLSLARALLQPQRLRAGRWLYTQAEHAFAGLARLRTGHRLARAFALSLAQWATIVACVALCAAVVGTRLGLGDSAFVVIGLVLAFAIPNAPGYLGATQLAFLAVLAPLGVRVEAALAASVVYTLLVVGPLLLTGAFTLVMELRARRHA